MYFKDYPFLSNFYECKIEWNGIVYPSVENAYQAQKCPELAMSFLDITPNKAKNFGKKVRVRQDWDDIKLRLMFDLVKQKFQDPELLAKLRGIKGPIVEHNWWHDNYWGACTCDKCRSKTKFNRLGSILEWIRDKDVNTNN